MSWVACLHVCISSSRLCLSHCFWSDCTYFCHLRYAFFFCHISISQSFFSASPLGFFCILSSNWLPLTHAQCLEQKSFSVVCSSYVRTWRFYIYTKSFHYIRQETREASFAEGKNWNYNLMVKRFKQVDSVFCFLGTNHGDEEKGIKTPDGRW